MAKTTLSDEQVTHVSHAASLALGAAVAAELVVMAFDRAGYSPSGQSVFIALAGVALLAAVAIDDRGVLATLRSGPAVLVLALAALSLASAGWTVIATGD